MSIADNLFVKIEPIITDDAIPAVIALASTLDHDDEVDDLADALHVIFADPDGPAQLIELDGVSGWYVNVDSWEQA